MYKYLLRRIFKLYSQNIIWNTPIMRLDLYTFEPDSGDLAC